MKQTSFFIIIITCLHCTHYAMEERTFLEKSTDYYPGWEKQSKQRINALKILEETRSASGEIDSYLQELAFNHAFSYSVAIGSLYGAYSALQSDQPFLCTFFSCTSMTALLCDALLPLQTKQKIKRFTHDKITQPMLDAMQEVAIYGQATESTANEYYKDSQNKQREISLLKNNMQFTKKEFKQTKNTRQRSQSC